MPFIPAIIGAAGAIGGALISHHKSSSSGPNPADDPLVKKQTEIADFAKGQANQFLPEARSTLELPLNYWKRVGTGDRYAALEGSSPDVQTITSQYDSGLKAVNEFAPRSGGRSVAMAEDRFHRAADITNLLLKRRVQAQDELRKIGEDFGTFGEQSLSAAASAAHGASTSAADLQRLQLERDRMDQENSANTGQGLGTILATLTSALKKGSPSVINNLSGGVGGGGSTGTSSDF